MTDHGYISVTNWRRYQHYRNRKPPWVKFYTELLHPANKINDLPIPTRFLFDRLLLLAAEYDNAIPNDSELVAKLLRMSPSDVSEGFDHLLKGKWISQTQTRRRASKRASKSATTETETYMGDEKVKSNHIRCPLCTVERDDETGIVEHLENVHDVIVPSLADYRAAA